MKDCQVFTEFTLYFFSLLSPNSILTFPKLFDHSLISMTILHLIEHKRVEKLLISFFYLKINKYNKYTCEKFC